MTSSLQHRKNRYPILLFHSRNVVKTLTLLTIQKNFPVSFFCKNIIHTLRCWLIFSWNMLLIESRKFFWSIFYNWRFIKYLKISMSWRLKYNDAKQNFCLKQSLLMIWKCHAHFLPYNPRNILSARGFSQFLSFNQGMNIKVMIPLYLRRFYWWKPSNLMYLLIISKFVDLF